jgi:hypothetical protein
MKPLMRTYFDGVDNIICEGPDSGKPWPFATMIGTGSKWPTGMFNMTRLLASVLTLCLVLSYGGHAEAEDAFGVETTMPVRLTQEMADRLATEDLVAQGRALFLAKFTAAEGAGRPGATGAIVPTNAEPGSLPRFFRTAGPDSNACRGCHNDPVAGGAGEFVSNAFVAEGFSDADFDSVDAQFSNERGTPMLNGSGLVELLAREMTRDLRAQRLMAAREARATGRQVSVTLASKGVSFGSLTLYPDSFMDVTRLEGVDQDLLVRPFSQKGVFTSLRQFTVNALNGHHGMQAVERFGARYTDTSDFDKDGVEDEMGIGDVTALVAFQALLPFPVSVTPQAPDHAVAVARGRDMFTEVGCASCHVPALPLETHIFTEPGPYNPAGNLRQADVTAPVSLEIDISGLERDQSGRVLVPVFSDFKRHVIADAEHPHFANELLAQRFVNRDEFLTARLWGVGSTEPYGHRGDLTTLRETILNHGGDAAQSRVAFEALDEIDRRRIIAFLQTLRIAGREVGR